MAAIGVLVAASCGGPTPTLGPVASPTVVAASPLGVANGTTVTVSVALNGIVVATVAAGETQTAIPVVLPSRPWTVEARSPSGRLLATLTVGAADDISATSSRAVSEVLACGRIELWAGGPHGGEPAPSLASPKPCE